MDRESKKYLKKQDSLSILGNNTTTLTPIKQNGSSKCCRPAQDVAMTCHACR